MAILRLSLSLCCLLLGAKLAQASLFFYPDKDEPWFSVEFPEKWQPKMEDETLEANAPDDEANLVFWMVEDRTDLASAEKDLESILQDSVMKFKLKKKSARKEINGIEFLVFEGAGHDSESNAPVGFGVWLFAPRPGKVGLFYGQYDTDAPAHTLRALSAIVESVKLVK